jgi:lactoylglutathione lyase
MLKILCCLVLLCGGAFAEDLPLLGLAHVGFRVTDLEKARAFYHGVLGYDEAFDLNGPKGNVTLAYFKVNDTQFIEIFPGDVPENKVMMTHIAMYTGDLEKLHKMIEERGLNPTKINTGRDGNHNFGIHNLPGQSLGFLEFVQYLPGSKHSEAVGKFLNERRISTHLEHAGIVITDFEAARHFYVDQLGFQVMWDYKKDGKTTSLLHLRMPGPSGDYVEIPNPRGPLTGKWIGVTAHISLTVPDVEAANKEVAARGVTGLVPPMFGPDNRWQLNLYDPDGTRVEYMSPKKSGAGFQPAADF